jgi:hypothetical protein
VKKLARADNNKINRSIKISIKTLSFEKIITWWDFEKLSLKMSAKA